LGSNESRPVFVDLTGRRRRLVILAGVLAGLLLTTAMALLVAGVFGASPVPLPGLPQGGQGAQQEAVVPAGAVPSADRAASTTSRPARIPTAPSDPTATPTSAQPAPSSSAPEPRTRGNRPSTHPGNPRHSKTK
jgi:hypothetical protein